MIGTVIENNFSYIAKKLKLLAKIGNENENSAYDFKNYFKN
jgi:hypothetical protein